jgi:hypothetical protein
MDTKPLIKSYDRIAVHNNLDKLDKYIVDMDLARKYQKYNNWNHSIIDRTGSMKHFLNVHVDIFVPKYIHDYKETFNTISIKRAQELLQTNKKIHLLFSGGLDSMAIISSFYNLDIDPNQIVIYLTHDSLYESGSLFDDILSKRFPQYKLFQSPLKFSALDIPDDELIVTGHHGNILMNRVGAHIPENCYNNPYEIYFSEDYLDFYSPFIKTFPRKIVTIEQYYSYFNFNFNWCYQSYLSYTLSPKLIGKTVTFFDTLDYQNYFVSCEDDKTNKNPMRKFILSQLGHQAKDYTIHKKVRNSFINKSKDWLFVDGDNKVIGTDIINTC